MGGGRGIAGGDTRYSSLFAAIYLEHDFHPGQVFVVRLYVIVIIFRVAWYTILVTRNLILRKAEGGSRKAVLHIG
jgi:hypothetical protein